MSSQPTDREAASASHTEEPLGVALARTGGIVLQRWRLFLLVVFIAGTAGLVHWYLNGRDYVAESRFSPSGESMDMGRLAGLAAQFGFAMPFNQQDESLEFYAQLAKSRDVLQSLATAEYAFPERPEQPGDTLRGDLVELLDISASSPRRTMQKALKKLDGDIAVSLNGRANLVTVRVAAPWAVLAEDMNRRLLEEVNAYNLERRRSRSAAERGFVERQVSEAEQALRSAESRLESFLERNRRIGNAPNLEFERDRLQAEVSFREQIYTSLSQALAEARIEEVRNTPVLTVIESPEGAARLTGHPLLAVLFALVPGAFIAFGTVLAVDHLARSREERPEAFAAYAGLRARSRLRLPD